MPLGPPERGDDFRAVFRLIVAVLLMMIGGGSMYAVVVVLPAVQAEFGVARSDASLPYTLAMIGFGVGGILMGKLSDWRGVQLPVMLAACCIGFGFFVAGSSSTLLGFALAHGVLLGMLGTSATFAPLIADVSLWFTRRRGIAVAICASGNYLAGAVWPPALQHFVETIGWRQTYLWAGAFTVVTMLPLALLLRGRPHALEPGTAQALDQPAVPLARTSIARPLGMAPNSVQWLLAVAGVSCCVAMSMPQVHIVAYCSDLGYGPARGAEMLAVMLASGIVSRLVSGVISDRIGGLRTLLLGSVLQGVALLMFLPFDSLVSLYLVSAMFGLFQGGIVPAYAIIVRELFPPREAGTRVGIVMTATMLGMALGGWLSGKLFDLTGGYQAAFLNGIAWNLLNVAIASTLLYRARRMLLPSGPVRSAA